MIRVFACAALGYSSREVAPRTGASVRGILVHAFIPAVKQYPKKLGALAFARVSLYTRVMFDATKIEKEMKSGAAVLLDVRTEGERATSGFAQGSIHFDIARLCAGEVPDIPDGVKVYIYCQSGSRALVAEGILKREGFLQTTSIGGLSDWEKAGGVVEKRGL